jgi:hypothetical protein
MKFGAPLSAGFGSPENLLSEFKCESQNHTIRVEYVTAYEGWYGTYIDSKEQAMKYCVADERVIQYVPADSGTDLQSISVIRTGWAGVNVKRSARWYDQLTSKRATLDWIWQYETIGSVNTAGNTKLSSWLINGVTWASLSPISMCRGYLDVIITVSGTVVTIDLQRQGRSLAIGACTIGDICYIDPVNDSGIGAQVTPDPTIVTGTEKLYIRYPESMKILRSTIDPPTLVIATVPFINSDVATFTESSDLTPDRYFYRIRTYSDTGQYGIVSPSTIVTIPGPPEPVTDAALASSTSFWPTTIDCNISFTDSITPGVEYKLYVQTPNDDYMNWNDVFPSTLLPGPILNFALPAIEGEFKIVIRTNVIGGLQEMIGAELFLEFDGAGEYIPSRPNTPSIQKYVVTTGLNAEFECSYDPSREVGVATHVHLYYKAVGGAYNLTPDASATLISDGSCRTASPVIILPSDGWYWIKIHATTAVDTEDTDGVETLIYVCDDEQAAPPLDGTPTRG